MMSTQPQMRLDNLQIGACKTELQPVLHKQLCKYVYIFTRIAQSFAHNYLHNILVITICTVWDTSYNIQLLIEESCASSDNTGCIPQ